MVKEERTYIPSVIPFGHWMSSVTSGHLSYPFIPAFSILAGSPQSDQYTKLGRIKVEMSLSDLELIKV